MSKNQYIYRTIEFQHWKRHEALLVTYRNSLWSVLCRGSSNLLFITTIIGKLNFLSHLVFFTLGSIRKFSLKKEWNFLLTYLILVLPFVVIESNCLLFRIFMFEDSYHVADKHIFCPRVNTPSSVSHSLENISNNSCHFHNLLYLWRISFWLSFLVNTSHLDSALITIWHA